MWAEEGWTSGFHGPWARRGREEWRGKEMGAEGGGREAENQEAAAMPPPRRSPLSLPPLPPRCSDSLAGPNKMLSARVKCQCHFHVLQGHRDAWLCRLLSRRGGHQRQGRPTAQGTLTKEPPLPRPGPCGRPGPRSVGAWLWPSGLPRILWSRLPAARLPPMEELKPAHDSASQS